MGKKILVYGLGERFERYRDILTNSNCLGGEIVAFCDKNPKKNISRYIKPQNIKDLIIDLVIVTCAEYETVTKYLREEIGIKEEIISFFDYMYKEWNVDRRAVKFLNPAFISEVLLVDRLVSINSFLEIGANFAQDATLVKKLCNIQDDNITVFEAHPDLFKEISNRYNYNAYNYAVSNSDGKTHFIICDIDKVKNNGMSSLKYSKALYKDNDYSEVEIDKIRIDSIWNDLKLKEIDFCKIDVEGNTWEVLKGFGNKIRNVKCFQIEADYYPYWENEVLAKEIFSFLNENGFEMIKLNATDDLKETDSLWLRRDLMGFEKL
ncbi:FkbM family methyltransferase [Pseudobutyrivibrio sp.]|uniref:FkbM family methyltransferase n=1 Tax=Pseudobutyrivibrio sp. TaxID=2014367 RepID=UPI0025D668C7|nr:FkbM family methyltransferase [Pseudobutyrivibrio sp.]MBR5648198.1 FkbM family methyltransferase [Pseudobutyrivibrio sp.]